MSDNSTSDQKGVVISRRRTLQGAATIVAAATLLVWPQ
jgi:hypothetical protein